MDDSGDRSFTFYRKPGADQLLRSEHIDYPLLATAKVFHFGSLSMTQEPSRTATLQAAAFAKENNALVSYDPNLRLSLWRDAGHAKAAILHGLQYSDIVKLSQEELLFLTETADIEQGSRLLLNEYHNIKLLLITLGAAGSYCMARASSGAQELSATHAGFKVDAVDTTGAGDAFFGGILYWLLTEESLVESQWNKEKLVNMLTFANAMGALTATGKGAIPSLPALDQVKAFMASGRQ